MKCFPEFLSLAALFLAFVVSGCAAYSSGNRAAVLPGFKSASAIAPPVRPQSEPTLNPRLYVAETTSNKILVFDPTVADPTPEATITKGLSGPFGITVDKNENLYVANSRNRTVTVYHPGKLAPSFTIDNGLGQGPEAVAVDSTGNVFVCTFHRRLIVAFHPGHRHAYQTIRLTKGTPEALAFDAGDNLYIADDSYVYELPRGATKPIDLGLTGLEGADGIAFANGILYVSNYTLNDVNVYKKGQTKPFLTITSGLQGPTFSTFVRPAELFQDNNIEWKIEGFKSRRTKPFLTILGLDRPTGVAAAPIQNP